jgi:hypothetical protein
MPLAAGVLDCGSGICSCVACLRYGELRRLVQHDGSARICSSMSGRNVASTSVTMVVQILSRTVTLRCG